MANTDQIQVEFIPGPPAVGLPRTAAEAQIRDFHPAIKEGAPYALEQVNGRWVAAVVHQAAPPPFAGGGPADDDEEMPGPKSEGPDDSEPSEDKSDPDMGSDSSEDSGPPKPKGEGKGEKGELHKLMQMLEAIGQALGIPMPGGPEDNPVPGMDGGPMPPPGPPGPPGGGPMDPNANKEVVRHERVTKPGETPPGGTPIGAPAFASVRENHPWVRVAGQAPSFTTTNKIGDRPLNEVKGELDKLASEIGYRVSRLKDEVDADGDRVAVAVITTH